MLRILDKNVMYIMRSMLKTVDPLEILLLASTNQNDDARITCTHLEFFLVYVCSWGHIDTNICSSSSS